jgi:hypothetical protein
MLSYAVSLIRVDIFILYLISLLFSAKNWSVETSGRNIGLAKTRLIFQKMKVLLATLLFILFPLINARSVPLLVWTRENQTPVSHSTLQLSLDELKAKASFSNQLSVASCLAKKPLLLIIAKFPVVPFSIPALKVILKLFHLLV